MVTRNTTSGFYPAPPKARIPSYGRAYTGLANVKVITSGSGAKGLNMSTAPTSSGGSVKGTVAKL